MNTNALMRLCASLAVIAMFAGCNGRVAQDQEKVPLANGDWFEYAVSGAPQGMQATMRYKIKATNASDLAVGVFTVIQGPAGVSDAPMFNADYVINPYGAVIKAGNLPDAGRNKDCHTSLWLPTRCRQAGQQLKLVNFFKDSAKVSGPRTWQNRKVWVLTIYQEKYYYDVDSGYLVGSGDGVREKILVRSSKAGLVK
jgi:hypothetical protein